MPRSTPQKSPTIAFPDWFTDFLADRAVRKPSPHTTKAHRQDFEAVATLLAGSTDAVPDLKTNELRNR